MDGSTAGSTEGTFTPLDCSRENVQGGIDYEYFVTVKRLREKAPKLSSALRFTRDTSDNYGNH